MQVHCLLIRICISTTTCLLLFTFFHGEITFQIIYSVSCMQLLEQSKNLHTLFYLRLLVSCGFGIDLTHLKLGSYIICFNYLLILLNFYKFYIYYIIICEFPEAVGHKIFVPTKIRILFQSLLPPKILSVLLL